MAPASTSEDGFDIAIKEVPVTQQRRPFIEKNDDQALIQPGKIL